MNAKRRIKDLEDTLRIIAAIYENTEKLRINPAVALYRASELAHKALEYKWGRNKGG